MIKAPSHVARNNLRWTFFITNVSIYSHGLGETMIADHLPAYLTVNLKVKSDLPNTERGDMRHDNILECNIKFAQLDPSNLDMDQFLDKIVGVYHENCPIIKGKRAKRAKRLSAYAKVRAASDNFQLLLNSSSKSEAQLNRAKKYRNFIVREEKV